MMPMDINPITGEPCPLPEPLLTQEKIGYLSSLVREHHRGAAIMRHVLVSLMYGEGFPLQDVKHLDGGNYRLMLDLLEYERERKVWPQAILDLAEYAKKRMEETQDRHAVCSHSA